MAEAIGNEVVELERIAFGPLRLGELPRGQARKLRAAELRRLWKDPRAMTTIPQTRACGPCAAPCRPSATTRPRSSRATEELMRELMERNALEPDDFVSVILTCTDDLNAQFPAVGARAVGLDQVPLLCNRELDVPGAMERVIRVLAHYYAPADRTARARLPRRDAGAARRPALRAVSAMSVQFAHKLAQIPGYVAGAPAGKAPESIADEGIAQLASNESPLGPHPAVAEAIARAAGARQPLPGPERRPAAAADRRALRGRPGRRRARQRLLRDPAGGGDGALRAGRRARLRLAVVLDLPVPGAAVGRARDPRRRSPRATSTTSTRSLTEITAATQLVIVCNPNNPTAHPPARRRGSPSSASGSRTTSPCSSTRPTSSSSSTTTPTTASTCASDFPNLVLLRTFSKVYGLAGLRVGYALCSPKFRAAVDAVRQPFSVNALAQAAAAEAIRHQDDVAERVERNLIERVDGRGGRARARARDARLAGELLLDRPRRPRRGGDRRRARRGRDPRPRRAPRSAGPGHIRVSYGTAGGEPPLPRRAG